MGDGNGSGKDCDFSSAFDKHFFGSVTVGERGQIVIPAEARRAYDIETGDKLLVMGGPGKKGLMICKAEAIRELMAKLSEGLRLFDSDEVPTNAK
jgi:AbrB family looped-hinge helix DNA binding protein